jgi:hypothetical protein
MELESLFFQHIDILEDGEEEILPPFKISVGRRVNSLPQSYALVLPSPDIKNTPIIPEIPNLCHPAHQNVQQKEKEWCREVQKAIQDEAEGNVISEEMLDLHLLWAAYHNNH